MSISGITFSKWLSAAQQLASEGYPIGLVLDRMQVWRTGHDVGLYPFHMQTFQALQSAKYIARVEFCR
jgi:hypothetical protein